ncbi:hypothetical protein OPV22_021302 [Ensete ventricosum]|uniref:Uncharacterized protein n=1 Tax=Ensete ventricosum TaxID=4639 RepID=A0AAV8PAY8_ENSVE|nr:hypothetical protein OPV22_021302 [Ensete ventricosum]
MARPLPGARCEPRPGDAPSARSLKSTAMSPAIRSRRPSTCASPHNSNPPYASAAALASAQTINITRFGTINGSYHPLVMRDRGRLRF